MSWKRYFCPLRNRLKRHVRKRTFEYARLAKIQIISRRLIWIFTVLVLDSQWCKVSSCEQRRLLGRTCQKMRFLRLHYENTPIQICRKFHLQKLKKFQIKNSDIFHIFAHNINCGYSLEPPRRCGSNEYPQSMFLSWNKKNNVYPCKPQFYYIKKGFKGGQTYIGVFSWYDSFDLWNIYQVIKISGIY